MADSALGFLLVHGGCHGGWCWERVIPHLDHPARAVDLPGRGTRPTPPAQVTLQSLVDTVCEEALATGWDRIILVGHSIAGTVLPAAAVRLGNQIAHAMFVSCVIPPAGGRGIDAFPDRLKFIARTAWLEPSPLARWTRRRGFKPPPGVGRLLLTNDLGPADQRLVLRRLNREPTAVLTTPVREQLPRDLPRTYVVLTRDRTLPPGTQLRMASRLEPVRLVQVESGHLAMLSQPERLAEVLNAVAHDPVERRTPLQPA